MIPAQPPVQKVSAGLRGEFVYSTLHAKIVNGELKPGDRLREVELAAELGVSRTPVREALKRLESEGLITFIQSRVLVVTELPPGKVMELYAMREILVGTAARFAAEQASPLEIQRLQQIVAQQPAATTPAEAAAVDRRFHEALAHAAHNDYLLRAMDVLANAITLLGNTTYSAQGRMQAGAMENARIAQCIAARDAAGAEAAAREHIRNASAIRLTLLFGADDPR